MMLTMLMLMMLEVVWTTMVGMTVGIVTLQMVQQLRLIIITIIIICSKLMLIVGLVIEQDQRSHLV